jgi:hypothetical protein
VTHGVHPSVNGVEPARPHPVLDRLGPDSRSEELRAADHPMLPAREPRDQLINAKRDTFGSHSTHNVTHLAHDPDRDRQTATELAPSVPKFARALDKRPTSYLT